MIKKKVYKMELDEFVRQYKPEVVKSYERYLKGWNSLQPGTMVRSLRAGFGGFGNQILTVKEICNDGSGEYVRFHDGDRCYLLYENNYTIENWWDSVEIVEKI